MSLRARLLIGMAVVAGVLISAAALLTRSTEQDLLANIDAQLRSRVPVEAFGPRGGRSSRPPSGANPFYVGIIGADGDLQTLDLPNIGVDNPSVPRVPPEAVSQTLRSRREPRPFTVGSEGDLRYRVLARPDARTAGVLVLALPLADVDDSVQRLVRVQGLVTLVVLGVFGLVTWWVLRFGVQPLKRMTAIATTIADGDLSQRVPEVASRTEAGELGVALNTMLGRIEHAFDQRSRSEARLRQFVADASHELRTPVTTIRGYAELYRMGGLDDRDALDSAMGRTEQEAVRMGGLVEDLLLLARLDQGRALERRPVDLGVLAVDAVQDTLAVDPARAVTASVEEGVVVEGDDGRLRQVVANLIGNALVHTPPGTPVQVRARRRDDRAVLEVHDDGPGMPREVAERAFERFYRADPARSRHRGGSGLGLSIVQAIVGAHAGSVSLASEPGRGTTVTVELPLVTPAALAPAPPQAVAPGPPLVA